MAGCTNTPAAAPVGMADVLGAALDGEGALPPPVVTAALVVDDRMKDDEAVGPAVLVELDRGKAQLVEVEVVVEVWPGQLVAVGLHWVMVRVLVRVWVEVVVMSASWARVRPAAARTVRRVLNCMVAVVVVVVVVCVVGGRSSGLGSRRGLAWRARGRGA